MHKIQFHNQELEFKPASEIKLINWIKLIIEKNSGKTMNLINYIFCSDDYLLKINKEFLSHNTYTDIITFNNSESENVIEADIYISLDRIKENAGLFNEVFENELHRVMIHGVLHLLGWGDKSEEEKKIMREKENECLNLLNI